MVAHSTKTWRCGSCGSSITLFEDETLQDHSCPSRFVFTTWRTLDTKKAELKPGRERPRVGKYGPQWGNK